MSVKEEFRSESMTIISCLSTDTKPTTYPAGSIATETDTGKKYEFTGTSWVQISTSGAAHTQRPEDIPGLLTIHEIAAISVSADPVTAINKVSFNTPIKRILIRYEDNPVGGGAATGKELYMVLGALSDADADSKMGNAGSRRIILLDDPQGDTIIPFANGQGPLNIYLASNTAETGTSRVYMEVLR